MSDFEEWWQKYREGSFDHLLSEVIMHYNVEDDKYYIYKNKWYYFDTTSEKEAFNIFRDAKTELQEVRKNRGEEIEQEESE